MRVLLLLALYLLEPRSLMAQKRLIDSSTILNWPSISSASCSNDGKFIVYKLQIGNKVPSLVIQAVDTSWRLEMPEATGKVEFTENSHWVLFEYSSDSVGLVDLLAHSLYIFSATGSFLLSKGFDEPWIAYRPDKRKNALTLVNLTTREEKQYEGVKSYLFSNNGRILLLQMDGPKDSGHQNSVIWHNTLTGKDTIICGDEETGGFVFDQSGTKLSFYSTPKMDSRAIASLRYYQSGMDTARILVTSPIPGQERMVLAEGEPFFSTEGDKLFFYLTEQNRGDQDKSSIDGPKVTLWSHAHLEDSLRFEKWYGNRILSVIILNGDDRKVVRLRHIGDMGYDISRGDDENYLVMSSRSIAEDTDYQFRSFYAPDLYLVSVKDGSRKLIKKCVNSSDPFFSYGGKYIIWFDNEKRNWFSYNIEHHSLKNITRALPTPVYIDDAPGYPRPAGIAGWMANDEAVFIYDRSDIWEVDPEGKRKAVNITGGFGRINDICFKNLDFNNGKLVPFQLDDELLLAALNFRNKQNGFFKVALNKPGKVRLLNMDSRFYYFSEVGHTAGICGETGGSFPFRARDKKVYFVERMSATEYPNWYGTTNFKEFRKLTQVDPQKKYNWYRSELIHWKLPGRIDGEGILYKPENFDSRNKYPVIFYYYEKNADMLNFFINPELSNGEMNIPWMVSNGYIVVMPNIYYKIGDPGSGVYNSILSAAQYMERQPWVDFHHMGLAGHSFGGWETNYMLTRTTLFAAAAPSSGVSDVIRGYEDELPVGDYYETGQGRMGKTLWDNFKAYFDNSPIFFANKVSAPVLIMHNKKDGNVDYRQGIQWYNALTRLNKKVWMLSYEGEGHTIQDTRNQLDYTIRLSQFFNYYLKGDPAPNWMTKGSDPMDKNRDYELDKPK